MPIDFEQIVREIAARVATSWPEVKKQNSGGGVWEHDQVNRRSHEERTLPFCVVRLGAEEHAEWGTANCSQEFDVTVTYIKLHEVSLATVRSKLQALKLPMLNNLFTECQCIRVERVDTSPENPALATILAKNAPFDGGSITLRFLVSEGAAG